jgi:hypothetical protein
MLLLVEGLALLLSAFVAYLSGGDDLPLWLYRWPILAPGIIALLATSLPSSSLARREAFFVVTVGWLIISFIGSLPYLISGYIPNITDAFFETMSGFTTTGATILDDIEALPRALCLEGNDTMAWRDGDYRAGTLFLPASELVECNCTLPRPRDYPWIKSVREFTKLPVPSGDSTFIDPPGNGAPDAWWPILVR